MTELSLAQELRAIVSEQTSLDLQTIIESLGEPCEVRIPIYETQTGVFANEIQDEDPIHYSDPMLQTLLLVPLADKLNASDEMNGSYQLNPEPLRGLLMGEAPPERSMITIRRSKPTHYYVLRRELLTDTEPLMMQVYMSPVTLPTEVIGEGPYLPTSEEIAELEQQAQAAEDSLADILVTP